jgi:predicted PurR-regulated permease PerM
MLLPHLLATPEPVGQGTGTAATIFAILASAVIVLGGLATLVRAIWKTATTLRDNTTATRDLTARLDGLAQSVDGRIDRLAERLDKLERASKP